MAVNPNWPLVSFQAAFNADPNDPAAVPTWSELVTRLRTWDSDFGRQYESDTNQAGEAEATLDDLDEALNPANASSPYAPGVKPMREFLHQVMWPPTPVGSAVNMLNTTSGYDPTFESYTVNTLPSWVLTVGSINAHVSTTTPEQGTQSLLWTTTASAGEQGVGWVVDCIPGQTYTASVWFRQTAANSTVIFINAGPSGTTTTTAGSYVRLSVTFTASQPVHQVFVCSFTPSLTGNCNVDAIQMETGSSTSTFSSAIGPVVYGIADGFVERWPSAWDYNGIRGRCDITCVDALAALAQIPMDTDYANAILTHAPDLYWPLNDGVGTTTFAETSGNNGPNLVIVNSKYGAGTAPVPQSSMNIIGDPSGVGVQFAPGTTTGSTQPGTIIGCGKNSSRSPGQAFPATIGSSWSMTAACWVNASSIPPAGAFYSPISVYKVANIPTFADYEPLRIIIANSDGSANLQYSNYSGGTFFSTGATNTTNVCDGSPHLIVATITQVNGGNTTTTVWTDGVAGTPIVVTTASMGGMLAAQSDTIQVGGYVNGTYSDDIMNGTVSRPALWNRLLTSGEIADLWAAGTGYVGELSGARITRYLSQAGYTGATDIDPGTSPMGPGQAQAGDALLDSIQYVTTSENGDFWADQNGILQFRARTARYLETTASWVFGENALAGEAPYEQGILYDFDDTQIGNKVVVTRTGGIITTAVDSASQKSYFPRELDLEIGVEFDSEAIDASNWQLYTHKQPQQRVSGIALHPSANPALWPVALGVRKGDRVTINRRTSAGVNMSNDFFIERIEHAHSPGDWLTSLELSPATGTTPWLLGDAVYGQLGITTVLGY